MKKDTFKNKELWDDVSSFIDESSKKAHKEMQSSKREHSVLNVEEIVKGKEKWKIEII